MGCEGRAAHSADIQDEKIFKKFSPNIVTGYIVRHDKFQVSRIMVTMATAAGDGHMPPSLIVHDLTLLRV
jgi:hypothetical protein